MLVLMPGHAFAQVAMTGMTAVWGKPYRHYIAIITAIVVIASGYAVSSDVNVVDVIADIMFTTILDAAYAVHVSMLNLTATSNIDIERRRPALSLTGAWGITTFVSDGHTYVAVAASVDNGVQILNVTDPSNITAAGSIDNGAGNDLELSGVRGITTFESDGHTYAAVASHGGSGVQILNVTNPSTITPVGHIDESHSVNLKSAWGITTFESDGHTYVAIAASADHGVQILNVTNPSTITPTARINDSSDLELRGATGIATFESDGHTYVAVAASVDNGVQILNVTNPSTITPTASIDDSNDPALGGAEQITIFKSGSHIYAAVVSYSGSSVQILNVTNPSYITAAGHIINNSTLVLNGCNRHYHIRIERPHLRSSYSIW